MNITYLRSITLKLIAPIVTLLFLLTLTASPVLAKAGKIKEFSVPTPRSFPIGITSDPDGNVWFTEFPIPTASSAPAGIIPNFDGKIWFAESGGNKIARITTH